MEGTPFGRYRLIEMLGRGGMGEVWRSYDTETKRTVAIKVLPPYLADDNEFVQRFRREAEAAAQLNSPHVIPIHHYGEIDGRLYVDMRLIDGRDLGALLSEGPLEPARAVRIIDQIAKALHAAHKVSLIHRDIKPSNILLDDDDFAYLIDFGIARAADETRMTKSGNTIGTFAYIAPERLDPQTEEDARADIYSLACVLYEALTGEPPFPGSTAAHLIAAHLNTPPPRPSAIQSDVPPLVDEVIATGMAKEPDRRYTTTIELANAARAAITVPLARLKPTPPGQMPQSSTATEEPDKFVIAQPTVAAESTPTNSDPLSAAHTIVQRFSNTTDHRSRAQQQTRRAARKHWPLVLTVITLSGAVIAVIAMLNSTFHGAKSADLRSTPSTVPPTFWTEPPWGPKPLPVDPTARLLGLVANGDHCHPSNVSVQGSVAAVTCNPGLSQIDRLDYYLYPDQATLNKSFDANLAGPVACPGRAQSPQNWSHGRFACQTDPPGVMWSIDSQLVRGVAIGHAPSDNINQLYQWWAAQYQ
jgi:serine/threonine-protein kinase